MNPLGKRDESLVTGEDLDERQHAAKVGAVDGIEEIASPHFRKGFEHLEQKSRRHLLGQQRRPRRRRDQRVAGGSLFASVSSPSLGEGSHA